ncbi:unnamed protein product [marine sediment metagenome]|uniref:Uncharacterized protein n=1 Tax=marine sediment metagenome TaxID=412755 RepID=X1GIP6_9ZZZZ
MADKKMLKCSKLSEITDAVTDEAIKFYDEGKLDRFWAALDVLDLLLDVEARVCEREL